MFQATVNDFQMSERAHKRSLRESDIKGVSRG